MGRRRAPEVAAPALLEAELRAQAALEGLREVAHGLFPRILQTEGLVPALDELAGLRGLALDCGEPMPDLPVEVRTAAYAVVRRLTDLPGSGSSGARVRLRSDGATVSVGVALPGRSREDAAVALLELEDRVGALGGSLRADAERGTLLVEAVLPCGS